MLLQIAYISLRMRQHENRRTIIISEAVREKYDDIHLNLSGHYINNLNTLRNGSKNDKGGKKAVEEKIKKLEELQAQLWKLEKQHKKIMDYLYYIGYREDNAELYKKYGVSQ